MKARLLSNVNLDPLVQFFEAGSVEVGGFNSILAELSDPASLASTVPYSHIFCLTDGVALLGDEFFGLEGAGAERVLIEAIEGFCARRGAVTVVANLFCFGSHRYLTGADLTSPASLRSREWEANELLRAAADRHPNLLLFDMELLFRRFGEEKLLSAGMWYAGRIPYSNLMFRELAALVRRTLSASAGSSKKVLVTDLDNTLWSGIVGELGPSGIGLSEEGRGKCFRDLQKAIKGLSRIGVLLAINSKNNLDDVREAFEANDMMVLKLSDFSAVEINWEDKIVNLHRIADTLNVGIESFVMLDDSPVERAAVSSALPGVAVPEFPNHAETLVRWFYEEVVEAYFPRTHVTAEDLGKVSQYAARAKRTELATSLDKTSFLRSLDIRLRVTENAPDQVARVSQLTQKTNQFNVTTRRYSAADIERFVRSGCHRVVTVDYEDKFGKEGIVGLAIVGLERPEIDTLLLSCRVIGRDVESRLLEVVEEAVRRVGGRTVRARFIPTKKNAPAADVFLRHGYRLVEADSMGGGLFEKDLA